MAERGPGGPPGRGEHPLLPAREGRGDARRQAEGVPASPPAAVATSAIPCARAATPGCRSANAMIAMPPIEWPAEDERALGRDGGDHGGEVVGELVDGHRGRVDRRGTAVAAVVVADDARVERPGDGRPGGGVERPAVGQHDGDRALAVDLDGQRHAVGRGDVHHATDQPMAKPTFRPSSGAIST